MITNFRIFGNSFTSDMVIDKFIIIKEKDKDYTTVMLCDDVRFHSDDVYIEFECFDIYDTGQIESYGGNDTLNYYKFKKIVNTMLLTPIEFYKKHTDFCIKLYEKIKSDYNSPDIGTAAYHGWYSRFVKHYKEVLETIPEFEHFASAEKYNL